MLLKEDGDQLCAQGIALMDGMGEVFMFPILEMSNAELVLEQCHRRICK